MSQGDQTRISSWRNRIEEISKSLSLNKCRCIGWNNVELTKSTKVTLHCLEEVLHFYWVEKSGVNWLGCMARGNNNITGSIWSPRGLLKPIAKFHDLEQFDLHRKGLVHERRIA